ncbi:acyltransferase family protein [Kosakonia arachidis]|nr:acyltransferase family protein [Kosakonia arachidis]
MDSKINSSFKINTFAGRDKSLDVAKGIMMASVVAGHISSFPFGEIFYYYHVAGFFLLSGFFFNYVKYSNSFISFLLSRKKIILQYCGYSLFFILMHNVFISYGIQPEYAINYSYQNYIISIINSITVPSETMLGAMWFIPVLIIMQIIFYSINKITNIITKNRTILPSIIVTLFFFGWWILKNKYIVNDKLLQNNVPNVQYFTYLPFFYVGYLLKDYGLSFLKNTRIMITSLVVIVLTYITMRPPIYIYGDVDPFLFITLTFISIAFVIGFSHHVKVKLLVNLFKYIGENTIHILALHFLFFKLATFILLKINVVPEGSMHVIGTMPDNGFLATLLYLTCGIFGPLLLVELYTIIKYRISAFRLHKV